MAQAKLLNKGFAMEVELIKTFRFAAAHSLSHLPAEHKCSGMHGHSYRVDIHVAGPLPEGSGWLMDFADLKAITTPVINTLDHANLNEIPGLEISTSEMIAKYIWEKIKPRLPLLTAVAIWESETSRCIYRGK